MSLRARIAIALHLFRGYCNRRNLYHPEIDRFVEHLWEFLALPAGGGGFDTWKNREPELTFVGLGDDYPSEFETFLTDAGVSLTEFRHVLGYTAEVLYSTMYGAADEKRSRKDLSELAAIAETFGVEWPDMSCFSESKWSDCHGWGNRPSEQELTNWRRAGRG